MSLQSETFQTTIVSLSYDKLGLVAVEASNLILMDLERREGDLVSGHIFSASKHLRC